jgi:hypothetical protein
VPVAVGQRALASQSQSGRTGAQRVRELNTAIYEFQGDKVVEVVVPPVVEEETVAFFRRKTVEFTMSFKI